MMQKLINDPNKPVEKYKKSIDNLYITTTNMYLISSYLHNWGQNQVLSSLHFFPMLLFLIPDHLV